MNKPQEKITYTIAEGTAPTAPLSERLRSILELQKETLKIQNDTLANINNSVCEVEDVDSYCLLVSVGSIEARMNEILTTAIRIKGLIE